MAQLNAFSARPPLTAVQPFEGADVRGGDKARGEERSREAESGEERERARSGAVAGDVTAFPPFPLVTSANSALCSLLERGRGRGRDSFSCDRSFCACSTNQSTFIPLYRPDEKSVELASTNKKMKVAHIIEICRVVMK
ncbi:hypothetical protein ALC57_08017 [Trachymyrmex cornetzi]|uniref:Uncharacterized protein n=1 Tax=Trachymyrmex cornetzi TaxID=471704 RepID=A0A195E385_9HYME|nr:hypothetical protein ALC57_08017 [Trachymyrmex cornetzi]